jgi:hypothetical protein
MLRQIAYLALAPDHDEKPPDVAAQNPSLPRLHSAFRDCADIPQCPITGEPIAPGWMTGLWTILWPSGRIGLRPHLMYGCVPSGRIYENTRVLAPFTTSTTPRSTGLKNHICDK